MTLASPFQSGQIVYLEHQNFCLYVEVIQVVLERQVCWVRPLFLLEATLPLEGDQDNQTLLYDLRQSSDLIWPIDLFQPALDTDVIQWLSQLEPLADPFLTEAGDQKMIHGVTAHQWLRKLVNQIWQDN
ncbi:MAG: hypothetical protein ACFBSC_19780 [Microcoleaceae cyanobacterium]